MSSYPSKASGTFTLTGEWTQEAIKLLEPVLLSWGADAETGLWAESIPSMNDLTTNFDGSGNGGLEWLLEDLDQWTRRWRIANPEKGLRHKLDLETYEAFLSIMHENDLCIAFDFSDENYGDSAGDEYTEYFTGTLTSDGKKLNYAETSRREETWDDLGEEALDSVVDLFASFITVPDEDKIREWIVQRVPASRQLEYIGEVFHEKLEYIGEMFHEQPEFVSDVLYLIGDMFEEFQKTFCPDTEIWMSFKRMNDDEFGEDDEQ